MSSSASVQRHATLVAAATEEPGAKRFASHIFEEKLALPFSEELRIPGTKRSDVAQQRLAGQFKIDLSALRKILTASHDSAESW